MGEEDAPVDVPAEPLVGDVDVAGDDAAALEPLACSVDPELPVDVTDPLPALPEPELEPALGV